MSFLMVFPWNLSLESLQVSKTFLSILAILNNAIVWMVLIHPLISKSLLSLLYYSLQVFYTSISLSLSDS